MKKEEVVKEKKKGCDLGGENEEGKVEKEEGEVEKEEVMEVERMRGR